MTRASSASPPVTAVLDAGAAWLSSRLGAVERILAVAPEGYGALLEADAGNTLGAGGKRLRPLLVLLCAGPQGSDAAVRAAAAIELIHVATLVHDDVLDAAPLRRGKPTVFATSGRDRAVSAGDLLFSRAFALLAEAGDRESVALLSDASVSLALGELAQRGDAYDTALSEERYLWRCGLKTGRLFECACLMGLGSREGSADPAAVDRMRRFGSEIGLAFQLLDDVLDVEGPPERTGKARGTDLLDGTVTLPLILAARTDPLVAGADLRSLDAAAAEMLCDRIADTGALTNVRQRALEMVASAKEGIEDPAFDPEQRKLLGLVADGVVQRYS